MKPSTNRFFMVLAIIWVGYSVIRIHEGHTNFWNIAGIIVWSISFGIGLSREAWDYHIRRHLER